MFRIGDDGLRWRGIETCGLALLLCLLLAPGALAQRGNIRLRVRQTATQSLTLIKPSDPVFEGMIDAYYPGLSQEPGYQTSIRPFLVLVRNDTALPAVAYAITWTVRYEDGSAKPLHAVFVNRPLMFWLGTTRLSPGDVRLIAPMYNVTPKEFGWYRSPSVFFPASAYPDSKGLASVDVAMDGVVYSDGTFMGADKTRVLQRYVMARFAARDEALAALNLIRSSTAPPSIAVGQLEKMFVKEDQWGEAAYQRTLLALYVRARGRTAMDLRTILLRLGPAGLEKILRNFVNRRSGGNTNPSMFGREYQKLSDNDPRVFGVTPWRPKVLPPVAAFAASSPKQEQPFTLTLAAPNQPVEAGKQLLLRVKITNTSNHAFYVPITKGGFQIGEVYQVHVRDQRGRAVSLRPPPSPPGGKGPVVRAGSAQGRYLKPGESVNDLVNVTDLYNLSRPGKYKIWVAETFYGGPHNAPKGLVKSNTVTVTVVK